MEPLYVVPVIVLALVATGLVAASVAAAAEARELRRAMAELGDLQPALERVRSDLEAARAAVGVRRHR